MCDIAINCEGGFEQVFEFSYLVMVLLFLSIGLTVSESAKLCNYMHFREPVVMNQKPLLQRANLDKAIDFMDSLEEDIPRGIYFCSHSMHKCMEKVVYMAYLIPFGTCPAKKIIWCLVFHDRFKQMNMYKQIIIVF